MSKDNTLQGSFSVIADFEGNINDLLNVQVDGTLPVLPLRNMVLFPGVVASVAVGRESSLELIRYAEQRGGDAYIAVSCQVDAAIEVPTMGDIYPTGTLAKVLRVVEIPNHHPTAILQSFGRISLSPEPTRINPFLRTHVSTLPEELPEENDEEFKALFETFREATLQYIKLNENLGMEAFMAVQNISNPIFFINFVATNLPFDTEEKALLLEDGNMMSRTFSLLRILQRELQFVKLKQKISERTREELDQQQKEYYLQHQIKNFQKELGNSEGNDAQELKERAKSLSLPENVQKIFEKEVTKLERMNASVPDYSVVYNYLDTILSLPWGKWTTDNLDLRRAQRVLDRDHYGMEKVKERILEHLAVMKVSKQHPTTILCLYGPPGVGKTSLCRSIAESLGRKYQRISLGGVHDESEIRGHRRTYIAAMCGRIMKTIIKAESNNPLLVLDEIDKVGGRTHHGDPQAALLELLDPEQNNTFHDNFLDFDYDLSQVFFIATANSLSNIPDPLRDRMELINVEGYLTEEKKEIAKKHLLPQALESLQLPFSLKVSPAATEFLIEKYTRESGVRQLEKQIAKLVRKIVLNYQISDEVQQKAMANKTLKPADVQEIMGTPPYNRDAYQGNDFAGVVNGLAWTAVGGEMLFIESNISRAKSGRMTITGNLGNVMKESALLAFQYVKSHLDELGVDHRIFDHWKLHLHFPEGAVPKDGPSAGITIATSMASTLTQRKVRPRLAMTGEITLRGRVLPVGGIKEKILAAKRAGITDIILSKDNEKNILDIPERYVKGVTFHFVSTVSEVWKIALLDEKVSNAIDLTIPHSKNKNTDNE